jgi:primase-polymerase (primpol)-like protein
MMQFPVELLEYKQWVLWRNAAVDGRMTKLPISPWSGKPAACDKPQTWSTYNHVRYALRRFPCNGGGFVFTEQDPFCGIDLDGCRNANGLILPEAWSAISRLDSYAELSPSGGGVHILVKAKLPGRGRRAGGIEIYDSARYFTVTGQHIEGTPLSIQERQSELDDLLEELFSFPTKPRTVRPPVVTSRSDEELIESAKRARNGERFKRLWNGDISEYGNDHSRADAALCCILAFWTGGNAQRIDRLFRLSSLVREKWDRPTGGETYAALTVRAAIDWFEAS